MILVCRWTAACDGSNLGAAVVDELEGVINTETSMMVMRIHLQKMLVRFKREGVKVWILKQVPATNNSHTALHVYMLKRFPRINWMNESVVTSESYQQKQLNANNIIDGLPEGLVNVVDPNSQFFKDFQKLKIYNERSYYRDDNHLTRYGSEYYLSNLFEGIFTQINTRQ